jgi:SulP family sulfate permease
MKFKNTLTDLNSGIVVFFVALPLCLGIAMACGVHLISGIISGVIGGILVTIFSGSKFSVSGPAAGLTAIVISAISQLGSFETFLAAVVMAGILQICFSIIKLGNIVHYLPNAVTKGMLAGIGIILIVKQIPHLIGYHNLLGSELNFSQANIQYTFTVIVNELRNINKGVLIIGVVSILALIIAEQPFYKNDKNLSNVPGPLLVVTFGILLTISFKDYPHLTIDSKYLVHLPTIVSFSDFKNNLFSPNFKLITTSGFWVIAFTLAAIASIEALLGIEAIDKLDSNKNESNTNKELLAQGIGNIACGFLGGLPVTSVIIRSSANINSGAKSKLSAIFQAILLLVSLLFFPKILALIPNASLAAILIMLGLKLTKLTLYKKKWNIGLSYFLPFITTIIVMMFTDLLKGVFVGLMVSVVLIIRDNIKFSFESTIETKNNRQHYLLKLPQQVTFFNKGYLIRYFKNITPNSNVIIDGTLNKSVDKDAMDVISDFVMNSTKKGIDVGFINFVNENTQEYI